MKALSSLAGILVFTAATGATLGQTSPYSSSADFEKYARKLRESALLKIEPRVDIPTLASPLTSSERYPWKRNIVTTIFWVGESAGMNNPVANFSSSWDIAWWRTYGGYDNPDPTARTADYRPAKFIPQQNPFYFALPYNDIIGSHFKPEASKVIPWFHEAAREDGKSVLQNRWICIRYRGGKECYAQWSDCGPFRTDHWEYVFGNQRPKPNLNGGAGLDISPSVRDYLGMQSTDVTDWKFVEWREVPPGPWRRFGDNNQWVQLDRNKNERVASAKAVPVAPALPVRTALTPPPPRGGPVVVLPTNN